MRKLLIMLSCLPAIRGRQGQTRELRILCSLVESTSFHRTIVFIGKNCTRLKRRGMGPMVGIWSVVYLAPFRVHQMLSIYKIVFNFPPDLSSHTSPQSNTPSKDITMIECISEKKKPRKQTKTMLKFGCCHCGSSDRKSNYNSHYSYTSHYTSL